MKSRIPPKLQSMPVSSPKPRGHWVQPSDGPSAWSHPGPLPSWLGLDWGVPLGLFSEHRFHFLWGRQLEAVSLMQTSLAADSTFCQDTHCPHGSIAPSRHGHSAGHSQPTLLSPPHPTCPASPRSTVWYFQTKPSFRKGSFCYKWCLSSRRKNNEVTA